LIYDENILKKPFARSHHYLKLIFNALILIGMTATQAQQDSVFQLECSTAISVNQRPQGQITFVYSVFVQDNILQDNQGRRFDANIAADNIEYSGNFERSVQWKANSTALYMETLHGSISRLTGQIIEEHVATEVNVPSSPAIRTHLTGTCKPVSLKF
jgi:hypothetical protein